MMAYRTLTPADVARIAAALQPWFLGEEQKALTDVADVIGSAVSDELQDQVDVLFDRVDELNSLNGASNVGILDIGGHFASPDVEGALTEVAIDAETLQSEVDALDAAAVHKTGNETVAGTKTFSNNPIFNGGLPVINGAAGTSRGIQIQTGGVNRWAIVADTVAEGGANAGSNLQLISANDAGSLLAVPVNINRATGIITLSARPVFGAATPWDSGNLTVTSATWSPTAVNVANTTARTASDCSYTHVDGLVIFRGRVDVSPTAAATLTTIGIPLPIASNFGVSTDAVGFCANQGATAFNHGYVFADTANDRLSLSFFSTGTASVAFLFSGSYRII